MEKWHLKWVIVGILLTVALAATFVGAFLAREQGNAANFHSIAGFWVSMIGFGLTLYTLYDAQRVAQKAQVAIQRSAEEAAEAARAARRSILTTLQEVKREVRVLDREGLQFLLAELSHAAARGDWEQVRLCARLSSVFAQRLAHADGFTAQERRTLSAAADDLRRVARYVRDRLRDKAPVILDEQHNEMLDNPDALLIKAGAKSLYQPLEIDHADDA